MFHPFFGDTPEKSKKKVSKNTNSKPKAAISIATFGIEIEKTEKLNYRFTISLLPDLLPSSRVFVSAMDLR